jgi:hypothetical protein
MTRNVEQEIYEDAQILRKLHAPMKIKVKLLGDLLAQYDNIWQVTGITYDAIKVFHSNNFKKISRMGINRSHKIDRSESYKNLLSQNLTFDLWWKYFLEINTCVLATSSENMSNKWSKVIEIDTNLGLFKSSGFAWTHSIKREGLYLKSLFRSLNL